MINYMDFSFDRHIITMEDPVEFYHNHKKLFIRGEREIGCTSPEFAEAILLLRGVCNPDATAGGGDARTLRRSARRSRRGQDAGTWCRDAVHTSGAASTMFNRVVDVSQRNGRSRIRVSLRITWSSGAVAIGVPRYRSEGRLAVYEFMYITGGRASRT